MIEHVFEFQQEMEVEAPIEKVFDFFSRAENLEKLTPGFLHFRILTPLPIEMKSGTLIDYRIKLHHIPILWRTRIDKWEPPHRFTDTQLKGPYTLWNHEHQFIKTGSGTIIKDHVSYIPRGGWLLSPLINLLFVKKELEKIFAYRQNQILGIFPPRNSD